MKLFYFFNKNLDNNILVGNLITLSIVIFLHIIFVIIKLLLNL